MRRPSFLLLISTVTICATSLQAYEPELHKKISQHAFTQASAQNDFLTRVGLTESVDIALAENALAQGAVDEDGNDHFLITKLRSLNHFFDPANYHALTVVWDPITQIPICHEIGARADNWGLHDFANEFRLDEIRRHYYRGLTGPRNERKSEIAATFSALGHLMHLVEDMGQPEHTRND